MEKIADHVVYHIYVYATQNGKNFNLQKEEFLNFLGIHFNMGYHQLPSWKDYWSARLQCEIIAECMTRNGLDALLSNLHVNDNEAIPPINRGKLYEFRRLITMANDFFFYTYTGTKEVSVDETMILFKGHISLKQYNPKTN